MSQLFSSFVLKNLKYKNRIVMPPMCMYSAKNDGVFTPWHFSHYSARIIGGVGTIVIESTGVEPRGRITNNDLGLWNDEQMNGLKSIVDFAHSNQAVIGIQLGHAGRRGRVTDEQIVAPSAIAFGDLSLPRELKIDEIKEIPSLFRNAAKRALKAGFDFVEIHAAHGYLLNEFMSPVSNHRSDEYGGSFENRVRLLREVVHAIREVWPNDKVLQMRVSAEDYVEIGLHPEDISQIINAVKSEGIDIINVSSGGVAVVKVNDFPGYQVDFASYIKDRTGLPVLAGGLIEDAETAEYVLRSGKADFIYLGRELLRDPFFPLHAAEAMKESNPYPVQYERAKK